MLFAALAATYSSRRIFMSATQRKVIDSAVHVWSNGEEPFPWVAAPPDDLRTAATHEELAKSMNAAGVSGALIVQPANHKFDHSYVSSALKAHPGLFKGMLLANPTVPPAEAVAELERLHAEGFVGVRFNPYLFPDGMDSPVSAATRRGARHRPAVRRNASPLGGGDGAGGGGRAAAASGRGGARCRLPREARRPRPDAALRGCGAGVHSAHRPRHLIAGNRGPHRPACGSMVELPSTRDEGKRSDVEPRPP